MRRSYSVITRIRRVLEDKREVLLLNIRIALEEFARVQASVREKLGRAYEEFFKAVSQIGFLGVKALEDPVDKAAAVIVSERAAFGVKIPVLLLDKESLGSPEAPPGSTPYNLDLSAELVREALEEIVKLAEAEATLRRLIEELKRTQKLINAIDHIVIPNYLSAMKRIRSVLDERMREDFVRLKIMKRKLVARGVSRG